MTDTIINSIEETLAAATPVMVSSGVGSTFGQNDNLAHEQTIEKLAALFDEYKADQDGVRQYIALTAQLLQKAQHILDDADQTIQKQQRRIRRLEELSTTDELTNLRNRRGLYNDFRSEMDRCERGISEGGLLLMIDLDNFKPINDTFGHSAGDACLRLVGRFLQDAVRPMDVVSRLGGDEFAILMCNTTKNKVLKRAQDLIAQINKLSLAWDGHEIPVRASIGMAEYHSGEAVEAVFDRADLDMYADKENKNTRSGATKPQERECVSA